MHASGVGIRDRWEISSSPGIAAKAMSGDTSSIPGATSKRKRPGGQSMRCCALNCWRPAAAFGGCPSVNPASPRSVASSNPPPLNPIPKALSQSGPILENAPYRLSTDSLVRDCLYRLSIAPVRLYICWRGCFWVGRGAFSDGVREGRLYGIQVLCQASQSTVNPASQRFSLCFLILQSSQLKSL